MHERGFRQSEIMDGPADIRGYESNDPRESFPMHFTDDEGCCDDRFFASSGIPFGGMGRGFGRRGRGMMTCDPRSRMCPPRSMLHPDRPFPMFGGRGGGGCRGRGMCGGRGRGFGRGGWRGFDDMMVDRFKHCRLDEESTSDSDSNGSSSDSKDSDADNVEEVEPQQQSGGGDNAGRDEDTHPEATTSKSNQPTADGDKLASSPPTCRRRRHHHHHCHRHGHHLDHHGEHTVSPPPHPFFRERFLGMPPTSCPPFRPPSPSGLFGYYGNKHCKKCLKKAMKESLKAHKKAWKKCMKKVKSDGEGVHADDCESHDDNVEFPSYPWEFHPRHLHHHSCRRFAGKKHGKGKRHDHGCCKHGKSTSKRDQQQPAGEEPCDVTDDDQMLMATDDSDYHTTAEPQSSSKTTAIPASDTPGISRE